MLFLEEPSHPYFLPLVERTIVGLPHPFGKSAILATSVFCNSTGGRNCFVGRLMRGLRGAPEGGPCGGVELEDVGQLTGLFPGSPGGTLSAPGDVGPCPGNCCWGNI